MLAAGVGIAMPAAPGQERPPAWSPGSGAHWTIRLLAAPAARAVAVAPTAPLAAPSSVPSASPAPVTRAAPLPAPPSTPSPLPPQPQPTETPLVIPGSVVIPGESPAPQATPPANESPAPRATLPPATRRGMLGRSPLRFSALGGFDLGSHHTSTTASLAANDVVGVSFLLMLERRTEQTSLSIQDPVGYTTGVSNVGQIQAAYRAPKYALTYGALTGPSDSQIGIGGFARGLELRLPRKNGELDLLGAAATQANGEGFRALGLRRQYYLRSNGLLTDTLIYSRGEQSGATNTIADASFQRYGTHLTENLEAALDRTRSIGGAPNGTRVAAAAQFNAPVKRGYASLTLRSLPNGFTTLTGVQPADRAWDLTLQRSVGRLATLLVDLGRDDSLAAGSWNRTTRRNLSFSQPLGTSSISLIESYSRAASGGQVTVNRSDGITANETAKGFSLSETVQRASAATSGGIASQTQESLTVGHTLGNGFVQFQGVRGHSSSGGIATAQRQELFSYVRHLGPRTDLTFSEQLTSNDTGGVLTTQRSTGIGVIRRISPVVALNITATRSNQTGLGAGAASTINVDLIGPLSFGGARYSGRANPNLPATVTGHVYLVTSNLGNGSASFGQRGVGNVLVLLDGATPVRTDIDGGYEFRFVKQGFHTISIVQATIANGLIADRGQAGVEVAGGQTVTVDFGVGQFAGIDGHLYAKSAKGSQPVAGVSIVVDGGRHVTTGPDGAYQIGGLLPGTHQVAIVVDSLPAGVQLQGAPQRTVQVTQGRLSSVDFTAVPLGSISGHVLSAGDRGFGNLQGAKNVYVVADPGGYAAITNDDGGFLLDNVPPGTYKIEVDAETIPDGESVIQGPDGPVQVFGGTDTGGVVFKLGSAPKSVVFSFDNGKKAAVAVSVRPDRAPPGAAVRVIVHTSEQHPSAVTQQSDAFGSFALRFDAKLKAWVGAFVVPILQAGDYALRVSVEGSQHGVGDASITVDPKLPLIETHVMTHRPQPGNSIAVTAKIVAPVEPGDVVRFEDGYTFKLPAPRGQLYAFDVRLWARGLPYRGSVENNAGKKFSFVLERP
ncbi:MAG: hypothetical protein KGM44_13485 [bacterium]|nr:hypothetical protein [bacterium]